MATATDNTALLEELMQQADAAEEPGTPAVVHKPTEALPAAMVTTKVSSAGYVYIYDTRTGDRSVTNRNMLMAQLKKTRKDGSRVFTTVKPAQQPVRGAMKCLLHADQPERARYAAMGFAACPKSNIPSAFQVRVHMKSKHRVEWATIEEARVQAEKDEERRFQRSLIATGVRAQAQTEGPSRRRRRTSKPLDTVTTPS